MVRKLIGMFALVFSLVSLSSCTSTTEATAVRVGFQKIPNSAVLTKMSGALESLGHEIEWIEYASGADVNSAFLSGSIDIGVIGSSPFAVGISEGLSYKVVLIHEILGSTEGLVSKAASTDAALPSMRGQVIATPFGSTAHFSLLKAIELAGQSPTDYTLVDMQPGDILAAWEGGAIYNAYVWDPVLAELKERGGSVVIDSLDISNAGFPTSNLGVASHYLIENNPQFVEDWVQINLEFNEQIRERQNDAAIEFSGFFQVEVADVELQLAGMLQPITSEQTFQGSFVVEESLGSSLEFLFDQGMISQIPSKDILKSFFEPRFIELSR